MPSRDIQPALKQFAALLFAAAAATTATTALAADSYTIDSRHTFPVFEVNHLGFSTQHGRFNKTSGKITLDAAAGKGSVQVSIDTASIDMGFDEWDAHMRDEGFFNTAKFPTMTYQSERLVFKKGQPVAAEGTLTLLGVSKPVRLAIKHFRCADNPITKKPTCGADVSATIKRSEFGMSKYVPAVGDEIHIHIPVEAVRD